MQNLLVGLVLSSALIAHAWSGSGKIYGVNLGSWLVLEPWMLPQEWSEMGGESCFTKCWTCIATESSFAKAYPDTVDDKFAKHWDTWFTQDEVHQLKAAGINTVRVPLGYWIVEALVDRSHEWYPRGGLAYLRRGLGWLQDAGIQVILDHHALPGVQTPNQMFTGNCTDVVQFYTPYNFHRALVWTAVMTTLSHLDPNFGSVFSIEAINEPIMNATLTPNYGTFQKAFVATVRAVECILGIDVPSMSFDVPASFSSNFTAALNAASLATTFTTEVQAALADAVPILAEIGVQHGLQTVFEASPFNKQSRTQLTTSFMDVNWQYDHPSNPADAANGPQSYDNHLYYNFGGVADANPTAYMISICNLQRLANDTALGDSPLWFGEWALPTEFNATDEFLYKWADAQKLTYSQGAGWLYWNFKTEVSALTGGTTLARQWSYLEGLKQGFLTQDPSQLHDPNVCAPYINTTSSKITSGRRAHRRQRIH